MNLYLSAPLTGAMIAMAWGALPSKRGRKRLNNDDPTLDPATLKNRLKKRKHDEVAAQRKAAAEVAARSDSEVRCSTCSGRMEVFVVGCFTAKISPTAASNLHTTHPQRRRSFTPHFCGAVWHSCTAFLAEGGGVVSSSLGVLLGQSDTA